MVEARSEQGLRGGALSTLEAMVVSMGFMAPSVAMFFNTPFIAGFAGAAMLFSFAAVFLVAMGFSQKTGFMGMWFFIIGYGVFEAATYSIFGGLGTLSVLFVYIFINLSVFMYFYRKEST